MDVTADGIPGAFYDVRLEFPANAAYRVYQRLVTDSA
jgi:hypothetical protein